MTCDAVLRSLSGTSTANPDRTAGCRHPSSGRMPPLPPRSRGTGRPFPPNPCRAAAKVAGGFRGARASGLARTKPHAAGTCRQTCSDSDRSPAIGNGRSRDHRVHPCRSKRRRQGYHRPASRRADGARSSAARRATGPDRVGQFAFDTAVVRRPPRFRPGGARLAR